MDLVKAVIMLVIRVDQRRLTLELYAEGFLATNA
jgi:hypothetical protein